MHGNVIFPNSSHLLRLLLACCCWCWWRRRWFIACGEKNKKQKTWRIKLAFSQRDLEENWREKIKPNLFCAFLGAYTSALITCCCGCYCFWGFSAASTSIGCVAGQGGVVFGSWHWIRRRDFGWNRDRTADLRAGDVRAEAPCWIVLRGDGASSTPVPACSSGSWYFDDKSANEQMLAEGRWGWLMRGRSRTSSISSPSSLFPLSLQVHWYIFFNYTHSQRTHTHPIWIHACKPFPIRQVHIQILYFICIDKINRNILIYIFRNRNNWKKKNVRKLKKKKRKNRLFPRTPWERIWLICEGRLNSFFLKLVWSSL